MYLRAAGLTKFVGLGVGWTDASYGKMAAEAQYDLMKKTKGVMGMPLFLRWGTSMKLANGCTMGYNVSIGEKMIS